MKSASYVGFRVELTACFTGVLMCYFLALYSEEHEHARQSILLAADGRIWSMTQLVFPFE